MIVVFIHTRLGSNLLATGTLRRRLQETIRETMSLDFRVPGSVVADCNLSVVACCSKMEDRLRRHSSCSLPAKVHCGTFSNLAFKFY